MLRLGITGGLASGKSVAAHYFSEKGGDLFDADIVAKDILRNSVPVHGEIQAVFGEGVLDASGAIDNARLAAMSFADRDLQQKLNGIIHPRVRAAAQRQMTLADQTGKALFVLDAPLLFEAGMEAYLDRTLLVVARQELRIKRALERGPLTEEDIRRRMNLQMPDAEKRVRADYVIENNDSLAAFEAKLDAFFDQLDIVAGA